MSSSDVESVKNLPQLNLENYEVWAPKMLYQLEKDEVWWTIEHVLVPEELVSLDELASCYVKFDSNPSIARYRLRWKLASNKATCAIMPNCDLTRLEEINFMVEDEQLEVWERLKDAYHKSNNATNGRLSLWMKGSPYYTARGLFGVRSK